MTTTISEMTLQEREMHDEDGVIEDLHEASKSRSRAVYKMFVRCMALPEGERPAYVRYIAARAMVQESTVEGWLEVPKQIPLRLLVEAFPTTEDGAGGWWTSLQWLHLQKAAQAGGRRYGPEDRIEWLVHAANNGLSPDGMSDWLRETGVIKSPKRGQRWTEADGESEAANLADVSTAARVLKDALNGAKGERVQAKAQRWLNGKVEVINGPAPTPKTACELGEWLFSEMRRRGHDVDLSGMMARRRADKPFAVTATLEFLLGEVRREHPDLTIPLESGGNQL